MTGAAGAARCHAGNPNGGGGQHEDERSDKKYAIGCEHDRLSLHQRIS